MTHSFTVSGRLISYLMLAGLVAYGLNYQITKTLLHLSALVALITWLRVGVLCFTKKNSLPIDIDLKDPRIILSTLLLLSASIVLVETSLSDTFMSARFRKDFVTPAICFALVLPVAAVDKRTFQLFRWAVPVATVCMAIPGIVDQYAHSQPNYRTSGNISLQIIYGTNLAILSATGIILMMTMKPLRHPILLVVSLLASILGIWAIMLSGSRGPLLSILLVSLFTVTLIGLRYLGWIKTLVIVALLCSVTTFAVMQSSMFSRLTDGLSNISSNVKNSSMGLRLEMWKGARDLIMEHPISGVGIGQQNDHFKARIQEQQDYMLHKATNFIHLHNDVINAITWMGIPLGLLFMAFAVYPLIWALKARKEVVPQAMIAVSVIYLL
uniref:O-antigen ligase family protein n=1 Tax=Thalassolituus sp. TaxID=2030822 RepID=UPI00351974F1